MRLVATGLMFAQAPGCSPITETASNNGGRVAPASRPGRIGGAHRGNPVGAIDDRAADAGAAKAC